MTSIPVTSTTHFLGGAVNANALQTNKSNELTNNFTKVMGNVANMNLQSQNNKSVYDQSNNSLKKSSAKQENGIKTDKNITEKTLGNDNRSKDTNLNETSGMKQEIGTKVDKLVEKVSKELGVSEDALKETMELMGILAVDLLNPDVMAQLVVTLSGETDMMSFVMDENLYGVLTELIESANGILQELAEQFHVEPETIAQAVDELKIDITTDALEGDTPQEAVDGEEPDLPIVVADSKTGKEVAMAEKESVESYEPVKSDMMEESVDKYNAPIGGADAANEKSLEVHAQKEESPNKKEQDTHTESGKTFLQGLVEQAVRNAEIGTENAVETSFVSSLETKETESIMKQMMDYMKINLNQNVTEMELQLHPASLGTVNLHMTSRNGMITAQFAVQNEGVKEALESQIVQLKENLEVRGIKVDAVEVTIASHEFERNLEQGGNQEARDNEKLKVSKKANRRRLVLEEVTDISDELEESDKIQAEMMRQRGDTVNFMA